MHLLSSGISEGSSVSPNYSIYYEWNGQYLKPYVAASNKVSILVSLQQHSFSAKRNLDIYWRVLKCMPFEPESLWHLIILIF